MAKKRPVLTPLSDDDFSAVRQFVSASAKPVTAKEVAQLDVASRRVTEVEVSGILEQAVETGDLFRLRAATTKGKPLYWGQDPITIVNDSLRHILSGSDRPLTAADLIKRMLLPFKLNEVQLVELIQEGIDAGAVRVIPPATAKGKSQYWDRDPALIIISQLETVVSAASTPLTLKEFSRSLGGPKKIRDEELLPIVERFVDDEKLHVIPPSKSKGAVSYWRETPANWARTLIMQTIQAKGGQSEVTLRKLVSFIRDEDFSTIVHGLVSKRDLFRHPPFGKVKKSLLAATPPRPEPYLQPFQGQLKATIASLREVHVPDEQLRRALVQLVESTGITFGASALNTVNSVARGKLKSDVSLEKLIRQLEPGADRGALVAVRDLRRAATIHKTEFDAALLNLAREGVVSLHRHDFPASLTTFERDDLVSDENGTYYVGVALRQNRSQ